MKQDIQSRADVELLVNTFYTKATTDPVIGFFFTEVAPINMAVHMPVMHDFWETLLLGNAMYKGNPMVKHLAMDEKSAMLPEHFQRWLSLWKTTADELFEGPVVHLAKEKADSIGTLMQTKMIMKRNTGTQSLRIGD